MKNAKFTLKATDVPLLQQTIPQPASPSGGVWVAEWLSHSSVVQEVPGSNPCDAESVGQ